MGAINWGAVTPAQAPPQAPHGAIDWGSVSNSAPTTAVAPNSPLHAAIAARVNADPISQDAQNGPSFLSELARQAGNLVAGGVRGAGSIGATTMYPIDKITDLVVGDRAPNVTGLVTGQQPISRNQERRQDMDSALSMIGADTTSPAYQVGKLGTEVAGTAGAGGLAAKALGLLPAAVSKAPAISALADSLASGGFNVGSGVDSALGTLGLRAAGGAGQGALSSALIDPSTAGTGAAIGAALPLGVAGAGKLASGAGTLAQALLGHGIGSTTGAGADALKTAFQAGKNGSTAFLDNLRGNVPMADVVDQARQGISNLRAARSAAYKSGMGNVVADKTVLDFQPIDSAINNITSTGFFKGQRINGSAADTLDAINNQVSQWKGLDPAEFHTAEGFDALKRSIGDIRDATAFGTPARTAADSAYNAVKGQINQQAPQYAKTMAAYADASDQISEITKALSLGEKASADTSLRKLQSLMRNNAQTNYGNRLTLAQQLQEQGNQDLMPSLAGQALSSWTPRGLVGAGEKGGAAMAAILHPASIPGMLAAAPFLSPRIMGEAAYGAGRLAGKVDPKAISAALLDGGLGTTPQALLSTGSQQSLIQALLNRSPIGVQ